MQSDNEHGSCSSFRCTLYSIDLQHYFTSILLALIHRVCKILYTIHTAIGATDL